jgi:hypothetical protein
MNVLLSIKPRYVEAILKGDKRYEFRKNIFRNKDVENVYIYATSPVKKLVGFFKVGNILEDHPVCLWDQLKEGFYSKICTSSILLLFRYTHNSWRTGMEMNAIPEGFKMTELGPLPEEWTVVPLQKLNAKKKISLNPSNFPDEIFEYYSIPKAKSTS